MIGGGLQKQLKSLTGDSELSMISLAIMIVLIKAFVVKYTFNQVWYKTWCCGDKSKFKPITFYESLLFVILIDFLF
jgi:hypothetical protein